MEGLTQLKPEGLPKAELYPDKVKIFKIIAAMLLGIAGIYFFIILFFADQELASVFTFMTACAAIVTAGYLVRLIQRAPRLSVYHNGINIRGVGFWAWKETSGTVVQCMPVLYLSLNERDVTKKLKPFRRNTYRYDDENKCLILMLEFPMFCMNMSALSFYKLIFNYIPAAQKDYRVTSLNSKPVTWRTYFFGKEEVTAALAIVSFLVLLAAALWFYVFITQRFFPANIWSYSVWIVTLPSISLYFWNYYKGRIKLNTPSRSRIFRLCLLTLITVLLFITSWVAVTLGIGQVYTEAFGATKTITVTAQKNGSRGADTCLKLQGYKTSYFPGFCLPSRLLIFQPEHFELSLQVKQSWFGIVIYSYGPARR